MSIQDDPSSQDPEQLHNYIQQLICLYLKQNNHHQTLKQFELELNNPSLLPHHHSHESLTTIVKDRINFNNLSESMDNLTVNSTTNNILTPQQLKLIQDNDIKLPLFNLPYPREIKKTKHNDSLVVHTSCLVLNIKGHMTKCLLFTCSNKKIIIYDIEKDENVIEYTDKIVNRLILEFKGYIVTCDMNGAVNLFEISELHLLRRINYKIHNRLITLIKIIEISETELYICSIGYDFKLCISKLDLNLFSIELIDSVKLITNPTCIEYTIQDNKPIIFVGILENSLISTFTLSSLGKLELIYKLALNDSEFNNYSFYPTSMIFDNTSRLLVISTSHIPYMRLITVMIPSTYSISDDQSTVILRNSVISNMNTMSLQDKYSNSIILQREADKGILIIGNDGIIRGADISRGKVLDNLCDIKGRLKTLCVVSIQEEEMVCTCLNDKSIKLITTVGVEQ